MVIFHRFLYVYQRVLSCLYGFTNNNYKAIIGSHISVGYLWDILVKHDFIYYGYMMICIYIYMILPKISMFSSCQTVALLSRDDVGLIKKL